MYVTRRLLRSTLEETTAVEKQEPTDASDEDAMMSPRKRRPLLQTQATKSSQQQSNTATTPTTGSAHNSKSRGISPKHAGNQGDKRNRHGKRSGAAGLRGMGMLIDARDSKERWCEAKILDLKVDNESVFIHYVGWNTRYDCWLEAKCVAAHGSHTGAKKTSKSWNGKDSLFSDPSAPNKPVKANDAKTTAPTPTNATHTPSSNKKKKKRPANDYKSNGDASNAEGAQSQAPTRASHRAATVKIEVAVDAVDEESERRSRRSSRREKVDLELEMNVRGESAAKDAVVKSEAAEVEPSAAKRTRVSPTAKPTRVRPAAISTTAKSPTTASARKPSPRVTRSVDQEAKTDSEEAPAPAQLQSPTVGMSALRRSARAALVAKKAVTKKRKKEEDDSDEEYKEEEDEEEEEEEEDDEEEDEVDESDDDVPVRRSSGKARRVSSSSSSSSAQRQTADAVITQWQTNPAYNATRERLSTIFRHRLQQRGELGDDFHGSFQQAMSSSSAASTPRSTPEETGGGKEEVTKGRKKKKAKTTQRVMDDEEKAAAAQYYYAQHYYHMQAYQYQQYLFQQALVAQQLEQQRLIEAKAAGGTLGDDADEAEKKSADGEEKPPADAAATDEAPAPSSLPTSQVPMMNGGIIDPRFIHARMDALEHQKRMQIYYQHYNQATERNLKVLATSPEYLHNGVNLWREQVQNGHQLPQGEKSESKDMTDPPVSHTPGVDDADAENKRPMEVGVSPTKHDEGRQVEDPTQSITELSTALSRATTPEAAPETVEQTAPAKASCSPRSPDGQAETASPDETRGSVQTSPSEGETSAAKTETVLFELVL